MTNTADYTVKFRKANPDGTLQYVISNGKQQHWTEKTNKEYQYGDIISVEFEDDKVFIKNARMKSFKLEVHLSNTIAIKMDGISVELNPSQLMDNIDTIQLIIQSIISKIGIDNDFNDIAQDTEAIKSVLSIALEYLKDSDVWIVFQINEDGQISSEIEGKLNYNIINLMSKANELFNS